MERSARPWESQTTASLGAAEFGALIASQTATLGIALTAEQVGGLARHCATLAFFNPRLNLTSLTDPAAIVGQLVCDSLLLLELAGQIRGSEMVDVGSGGGFPGLPLAIARPDWSVELLERKSGLALYLDEAVRAAGVTNATVCNVSLEEYPRRRDSAPRLYCAKAVFHVEQFCALLGDLTAATAQAAWWGAPGLEADTLPLGWNLLGAVERKLPGKPRPSAVYLLSRE